MRDLAPRRALKIVVRGVLGLELALRRWGLRLRGEPRWRLGGRCEGCARCCEAPTLRTGALVARLPTLRALFVAWQRHVNGWELQSVDRPARLFTFRCTHFDPVTRRCDSYASRPLACRDYPRGLLFQPWPEFFEGCGHRPIAIDGEERLVRLRSSGLAEAQVREIARRLRLQ